VRDKNCHLILAHQSIGDLEECKGLDPTAVRGAVLENTGIKFIYRAKTPETAEWASELSGTIIARTRRTDIQQSAFDAATAQYSEVERALLTKNDILALPKLVGMLFGVGLAKRCQAARMPKGEKPKLVPAPRAPEVAKTKGATKGETVPENEAAAAQAASSGQPPANNAGDPAQENLT
jgi:type IV secretory pathway TraG/TraD family ATPase VirD4